MLAVMHIIACNCIVPMAFTLIVLFTSQELWALFDFVHFGSLLGTARTFKMEFDTPITRSREKDATAGERRLGQEMAESLKRIIAPYFLRRTKAEVEKKKAQAEGSDTNERVLQ